MEIGIKCEIHSCTIEVLKIFLSNYFLDSDFDLVEKSFQARIDAQYYVNREVPDENYNLIIKSTPLFLVKCKNIILTEKEIDDIRKKFLSKQS